MNNKKLSALLGSVLLLAAAMPLATAHLTNTAEGSWTSGLFTGDDCRWEGPYPGKTAGCHSDGVSGTYVTNPQNVFLTSNAFPLTIKDQSGGITGDVVLFPLGYSSGASALCDLEVLGPGGKPADPLDETVVDDGDPPGSHNPKGGGTIKDGTWDDGGIGGACHTEDQYVNPSYNTPGCGNPEQPSHAVAEDAVSGGAVWIGVACDETTAAGTSFSLSQCLINEAISGADPAVIIDCVETFINGGGGTGTTIICGSDSIADAVNYGAGQGSNSPIGVPYPTSGCGGGSAAVFVYNYVSERSVIPATAGWIDSRDLADAPAPVFGPGLTIP